jgi:hypothetical protein
VLNENLPWDAGIDETGAAIIASVAVLSGFTRLTVCATHLRSAICVVVDACAELSITNALF